MADHRVIGTDVPQDGASRIIRKLDSIEKKLTLILWILVLPLLFALVSAVVSVLALAS